MFKNKTLFVFTPQHSSVMMSLRLVHRSDFSDAVTWVSQVLAQTQIWAHVYCLLRVPIMIIISVNSSVAYFHFSASLIIRLEPAADWHLDVINWQLYSNCLCLCGHSTLILNRGVLSFDSNSNICLVSRLQLFRSWHLSSYRCTRGCCTCEANLLLSHEQNPKIQFVYLKAPLVILEHNNVFV